MILRLLLDLPEDIAFLRTTRLLSRTLLEDIHVVHADINDVETIVAELCTNVVLHAHSHGARYQVTLEYHQACVAITVVDQGRGFLAQDIPPVGAPRPDFMGGSRLGGFGLPLLEALSDKITFMPTDPHGTTVRAEKNLHYATAAAAAAAQVQDDEGGDSGTMTQG